MWPDCLELDCWPVFERLDFDDECCWDERREELRRDGERREAVSDDLRVELRRDGERREAVSVDWRVGLRRDGERRKAVLDDGREELRRDGERREEVWGEWPEDDRCGEGRLNGDRRDDFDSLVEFWPSLTWLVFGSKA